MEIYKCGCSPKCGSELEMRVGDEGGFGVVSFIITYTTQNGDMQSKEVSLDFGEAVKLRRDIKAAIIECLNED